MTSEIEVIARVAHEVNRAYCAFLGDATQPAWADAPEWQRASCEAGVKFHIENPNAGPAASHDNWMRHKLVEGWMRGSEKDPARKRHPCLMPFHLLPAEQQAKDWLFRGVVYAMRPSRHALVEADLA